MPPVQTPPPSRHFDFRLGFGIPVVLMGILLLFDFSKPDFFIEHLFYSPAEGFVGKYSYWLENILHDRIKQVLIVLAVLTAIAFVASLLFRKYHPWRRTLGYLVLAITLSTSIVSPLKIATGMHCPWSLTEFGGTETYTPLLSKRTPTQNPGRCWPGGHASAGFSLLAVYFALRDRHRCVARIALGTALTLGTIFSVARTMQGAHFLSHNVWTLLIDWIICLLCYRWLLYRHPDCAKAADNRYAFKTV